MSKLHSLVIVSFVFCFIAFITDNDLMVLAKVCSLLRFVFVTHNMNEHDSASDLVYVVFEFLRQLNFLRIALAANIGLVLRSLSIVKAT